MPSPKNAIKKRELSVNKRQPSVPEPVTKESILKAFDTGDYATFYRRWPAIVGDLRQQADSVRYLDFYLRMYFATESIRRNETGSSTKSKTTGLSSKAMDDFKIYLDTESGRELSKIPELTPYFALPYVKNVERHPLFLDLKNQKWADLIRSKLTVFLDTKLGVAQNVSEVAPEQKTGSVNGTNHSDEITALKNRLITVEKQSNLYKNRCVQLQSDYHRLILVASELVDALEQSICGIFITPEQVEDLRCRMFDTRRPYKNLRNGTIGTSPSTEDEEHSSSKRSVKETPEDPQPRNGLMAPNENCISSIASFNQNLDWSKVRRQLVAASSSDAIETALLMQALRWLLTKAETQSTRMLISSRMFQENFLGICLSEGTAENFSYYINCNNDALKESFCRLANAVSSLKEGRSYLLRNKRFLPTIVEAIENSRFKQMDLNHILALLQKLSLRRSVQMRLIRLNLVPWLIEYLRSSYKTLTGYAAEYAVALLMNLSLTTAGRKSATQDPELILTLLCDLLKEENTAIYPYVNGTLFSVLSLSQVRHKAKKMGLHGILDKAAQRPKTPDNARQIPFIIKQLNGEFADKQPPTSEDENTSADDGNDEAQDETIVDGRPLINESGEHLEPEIDEDDALAPDDCHRLSGFQLLLSSYCLNEKTSPERPPVDASRNHQQQDAAAKKRSVTETSPAGHSIQKRPTTRSQQPPLTNGAAKERQKPAVSTVLSSRSRNATKKTSTTSFSQPTIHITDGVQERDISLKNGENDEEARTAFSAATFTIADRDVSRDAIRNAAEQENSSETKRRSPMELVRKNSKPSDSKQEKSGNRASNVDGDKTDDEKKVVVVPGQIRTKLPRDASVVEYVTAFGSRPRIVRTPLESNGRRMTE